MSYFHTMRVLKGKTLLLIVLAVIFYQASQAQILGLDLIRNKKQIEIPFQMQQGFIVVKVWFENVVPLQLIFDTGAENTILFDKEIAQILRLPFDRQIAVTGSDLDSIIIANIIRNTRMQLENCYRVYRDIIVLEENDLLLKEKLGIEVDGIMGGSFFSNLVVKINYAKQKIILQHPNTFNKIPKNFHTYDLEIISSKPYVKSIVVNTHGKPVKATLLIDTGASLPFLVHTNTDTALQLPSRLMVGNIGFGLSGAVKGFLGITERLSLGDYTFDQIATSFQDIYIDTLYHSGIIRNGILGNTLLSRFYVIIDYSKEKLYLKATRKYNKPFEYDKSGLTIFAVGQDLKQYYVTSVIEGSPAAMAGIQVGDIILKINRRNTTHLRLQDITRRLSRKSGKKIKLKIKRDDETIKTEFILNEWFERV